MVLYGGKFIFPVNIFSPNLALALNGSSLTFVNIQCSQWYRPTRYLRVGLSKTDKDQSDLYHLTNQDVRRCVVTQQGMSCLKKGGRDRLRHRNFIRPAIIV